MNNINSDINLTMLSNDKILCHNKALEHISVIKIDGERIEFSMDEIDSLIEYVKNIKSTGVKKQIDDLQESISQCQSWINDLKQQQFNTNIEIQKQEQQLNIAFDNKNIELINSYHANIEHFKEDTEKIINKINTHEETIRQYQNQIEEIQKNYA